MKRAIFPTFAALSATTIVAVGVACSLPDQTAVTEVTGPDFGEFSITLATGADGAVTAAGVDSVLEQRCGSLDCHGQMGRALRIFSESGLRLISQDAQNIPGGAPTTPTELVANYQAVIGLQPELMTEVVQGNEPPTSLLLLRKPLQLERHKGGQVIIPESNAYNCIVSWLGGPKNFSPTACANAMSAP